MDSSSHDQAAGHIDAHARSIDDLHAKLAALPGASKDRLQTAVDKYKSAHKQFRDDALGCMN
ncbi:MAG TPA: hypothetical protein VIG32_10960 [Candidatus Baltobacteraceae bacterium]|jgi:hypothetical protein